MVSISNTYVCVFPPKVLILFSIHNGTFLLVPLHKLHGNFLQEQDPYIRNRLLITSDFFFEGTTRTDLMMQINEFDISANIENVLYYHFR